MGKRIPTEELIESVKMIIDEMIKSGEKITFYSVAEKAEVSRQFLYNHTELSELISSCRLCTDKDEYEVRRQILTNENKKLLQKLSIYEEQLFNKIK